MTCQASRGWQIATDMNLACPTHGRRAYHVRSDTDIAAVSDSQAGNGRGKTWVAWALAADAGFIDAIGYLTLHHLFTAHMSGNSARLGVFLGAANAASALPMICAVALFVFGIGAGTALAEIAIRRGMRSAMALLLGVQALLLAAFMACAANLLGVDGEVPDHGGAFYLLAALLIVSIGFQTCALQRVAGARTRTTYVSGMLTKCAQEIVNWMFWLHDGARRPQHSYLSEILEGGTRGESAARALLFGGIWCCYLVGAIVGSWLDGCWTVWAMALPIAALVVLVLADWRWPFRP